MITILYRYSRNDTWSERTVAESDLAEELEHFATNGAETKLKK